MTTVCKECGAEIQEATAARTKGKCMPCSYRRHTRLKPDVQNAYDDYAEKLGETGWEGSLPHRRQWLDLQERLKAAIRRSPDTAYLALAERELSTSDCASPQESFLTIGNLRILASGMFNAEDVRETCEDVSFRLGTGTYTINFERPVSQRREYLLSVANEALLATGAQQRFLLLPSPKSPRPLVFVDPLCVERAIELGLIPDQA